MLASAEVTVIYASEGVDSVSWRLSNSSHNFPFFLKKQLSMLSADVRPGSSCSFFLPIIVAMFFLFYGRKDTAFRPFGKIKVVEIARKH